MFQEIALFPHMSTSQNVGYGPRVRGRSVETSREFIGQVMEMVRLETGGEVYPAELSGGARQKTALARAIAAEPQLMLLDEPLGALDAYVRAALRYELRRLVKELGLTAIHVTHDQEEAMSISDRLVIMKAGRIVEVGTPLELYLSPKRLFTANFLGEANFLQGSAIECGSGQITATVKDWKITFPGNGFETGDRVVLAIRPEWVMLNSTADQSGQEWTGVVKEQILLGDIVRTGILLDNDVQIVAHAPNTGLEQRTRRGEPVRIGFSVGSVLSYPWPAEGLDAELALE
jgi:putative spermidine/putrescine transport system ATP-binding protein